jgi:hypothetical protein
MRVIIHGGMFKTGTTTLQKILNDNRELLALEGIEYPYTKIGQHSHILNVRDPQWDANHLREIAKEAEQNYVNILLFSGEAVSALSHAQFKQLTACFEDWPTEYVFCFRHWSSFLPSRWKQSCLRRDSQTFAEYLSLVTNPSLAHFDIRYDQILSGAMASGADAVRSVSWDNAIASSESSVPETLSALGLNQNLIKKLTVNPVWLNRSSSIINIEICRILNGLLDFKNGLKANELFWAYSNHQECMHFHDIIHLIHRIDTSFKQLIENRILETGTSRVVIPNMDDLEVKLLKTHGDTFVNLQNNRIFNIQNDSGRYFTHYAIPWQYFIDLLESPKFDTFEVFYHNFKKRK